jgi:hypothetical protein
MSRVTRDHDIYLGINKSPEDVFYKTTEQALVAYGFQFDLPEPVSPSVNSIVIHPFPFGSIAISDLEIQVAGGVWQNVTGWGGGISNALNTHWIFSPVDYAYKVRGLITFVGELIDEELAEVYVTGLHNFDIGLLEFASQGSCTLRMRAPTAEINYLRSVEADLALNTDKSVSVDSYFQIELYRDPDLTIKVYDSNVNTYPLTENDTAINVQQAGAPIEELWAKIQFTRTAGTSPVLKDLKITYT